MSARRGFRRRGGRRGQAGIASGTEEQSPDPGKRNTLKKLAALGVVTIVARAGDEGKLFGSVTASDVADAVTAAGVEVAKSEVKMPEGALRQIGEFELMVQLHTDVAQNVTVQVVAE